MKNSAPYLAILLLASVASADEGKVTEFKLPDEVHCEKAIAHSRCFSGGDNGIATANCKTKIAFELQNGQISENELSADQSNATNSINILTPFRVIAWFITFSGSESIIASNSGETAIKKAQYNLQDIIRGIHEQLSLHDVKQCDGFKDDSKDYYVENHTTAD